MRSLTANIGLAHQQFYSTNNTDVVITPMPPILRFYTLQVTLADAARSALSEHVERHSVFLSADLRACTQEKAMMLSDRSLGEELLAAIRPRLLKRYGIDVRADVVSVEAGASANLARRAALETARIRARVDQQVFAPNKRPVGLGAA